MKQLSPLQIKLLHRLGDGKCHSGSDLGEFLQITRTAIWKQISQLTAWGLAIKRIPQRGYQLLTPLILLNEDLIRSRLNDHSVSTAIDFHLAAELDSTNSHLKSLPLTHPLTVCCAEKQTQGRGRFGRHWSSPFGDNIYFSLRCEWNQCLSQLSGLSLVVSLALLHCLKCNHIAEGIGIKWPNDLLWQNRKLAGVLIEVSAESNGNAQLIIGIGINVNSSAKKESLSDKPWCSLYDITGHYLDRNRLIADLIVSLNQYLEQFKEEGFKGFRQQWLDVDLLKGQDITVSQPTGTIHGQALGVNDAGQLCLMDSQGHKHFLSSGDASLSAM
ncbi:biotin--[acetyl-CoA-carboxylase] ligase [Legionella taurinensis]|uniref:Bifunctional ligase/repressor BirA n=1 Tax=Legionella taurinensis TaxID=70611 RepID=A0AB38N4L1_9GAMM|nr:biotin--[acetyl-CoA-carboxylase] ligase [Legionella taurinensis]MDX1837982.1 biotin--[acetyl-CoA-carboxylase] ligase [Legionella taurinensis]PUT39430.1 biotin--[acetyl-CoA-carboxylase] ligase [Legionella taurinensis]PUT41738.1 biotin--[acetyl-CoA-carboxylase] ligase [Legionella taurinensis]PUT44572.1 biotin--[acetyl-CoA-carboxylase] ligase [Legionella taurinensis]PUT46817.1 biotin--[acetyl-CoA-carboxylase] ligase [Legionella taurinensis]